MRSNPSLLARLAVALVACSSVAVARGDVLVVDAAGGAGSAYLELQPAIDAAVDGDLILVRSGTYSAFRIAGKALFVQAESGADVLVDSDFVVPADVRDLSAGQHVVLRGLELQGGTFASVFPMPPTVVFGLSLTDNAGSVWVEDCRVRGTGGGASVARSSVVLSRCDLGADDLSSSLELYGFPGGTGLVGEDARVHLFDSLLDGGNGSAFPGLSAYDGGNGATLDGGFLFASRCAFTGGGGGISVIECANGGDGLALDGNAQAWTLASTLVGGPSLPGPFCSTTVGDALSIVSGAHRTFAAAPIDVVAESPADVGAPIEATVSGPPGALAFLAFGPEPDATFRRALSGCVLLGPPHALRALGRIPASGTLDVSLRVGAIGTEGVRLQVAYASAGGFVLGGASAVVGVPR